MDAPIITWPDDACGHCPNCGWTDFMNLAPKGHCPCCGVPVLPPDEEAIEVETKP